MQGGLEDWEYWIALGELGVCGVRVPEPLYWYRRQAGGRLARLKADPDKWHRAYNRMRELHIDSYNGRRPVGCCGGGRRVAGVVNRAKALPKAPQVAPGQRVLVIYNGKRKGGFGMRGQATGVRYSVPGRGDFLVDQNGKPGVDRRDVGRFLQMGGFKVVPPAASAPVRKVPKPAPAPVKRATPQTSEAWEPAQAAVVEVAAPDVSALSLRQIKAMDLSTLDIIRMLSAELDGKNRKTVIAYLEKLDK